MAWWTCLIHMSWKFKFILKVPGILTYFNLISSNAMLTCVLWNVTRPKIWKCKCWKLFQNLRDWTSVVLNILLLASTHGTAHCIAATTATSAVQWCFWYLPINYSPFKTFNNTYAWFSLFLPASAYFLLRFETTAYFLLRFESVCCNNGIGRPASDYQSSVGGHN